MKKTLITILTLSIALGSYADEAKDAKAPDFTLENYDGNEISLSDHKGKIIVLEWFNYECPFSKYIHMQTDLADDLSKKYEDKDVIFLAINSTHHAKPEKSKEFAEKHGISYPILDDRSGKVGKAYDAKTTPHMFVIDKNGHIAYEGAFDNAPLGKKQNDVTNYVAKALDELLAGKQVSVSETKPYGCSVKYAK